ncbi:MAG: hypothetical protein AUJ72_03920 [Candidatus Omnitrophica bacterium CG1_02_46_14]|nr:MAG: hypothetical protein AUJ72_03920 [Candidatus Omnitrophica bacterium CG1_02_46_14]
MTKILTIDDEIEFTTLIQSYFGPRGYEVLVANDGAIGLELAKKENPDVCLIDLKMPGLHGDELLREALLYKPSMKCIMITASEGEGKTREKLLSMGAYSCFDKPLTSLRDLENAIKEAIISKR